MAGPHVLTSVNVDVTSPIMKCIVDSANDVCLNAKRQHPDIFIIARTLQDCPQDWEYANADPGTWYARIKPYLPRGYDAYEVQNECLAPSLGYDVWAQWSIKLATLINKDYNASMLAFSFAAGNPGIAEWRMLLPYLEWVQNNPLPNGRYNGIATHSSVYMENAPAVATWVNNVWLAGRETLVADYLLNYGFDLRTWKGLWIYTETGLDDGYSGLWDYSWSCAQYWDAFQTSQKVWQKQGIVDGFTWWNIGKLGKWADNSRCWQEMTQ